jgi:hypothetical protein
MEEYATLKLQEQAKEIERLKGIVDSYNQAKTMNKPIN